MIKNENNERIEKKPSKNTLFKIIVIILLLIIIILLLLTKCQPVQDMLPAPLRVLTDGGQAKKGQWEGMSADEIRAEMMKRQQPVRIRAAATCVMKDGKIETIIENYEENTSLWQANFLLADTGELVGKTTPIYPGEFVDEAELIKQLPPGSYECNIQIELYEPETKTYLSQKIIAAKLIVE